MSKWNVLQTRATLAANQRRRNRSAADAEDDAELKALERALKGRRLDSR